MCICRNILQKLRYIHGQNKSLPENTIKRFVGRSQISGSIEDQRATGNIVNSERSQDHTDLQHGSVVKEHEMYIRRHSQQVSRMKLQRGVFHQKI